MNVETIVGSIAAALVFCSNAQGLTQEQINQGCVDQGRTISCPSPMKPVIVNPIPSAGRDTPQATTTNQQGCVSQGRTVSCPDPDGPKPYVHTFELPQFGRNWQVYIGGVAYQTENVIDGTRWLYTSTGARLPDNVLNIAKNGTYWWTADGKLIKGHWIQPDKTRLVLLNAYEGKDWSASTEKFGDDKNGTLVLWHENEQLRGK